MNITAVKTRPFHPPQDDILPELEERIGSLPEYSVLAVTSKIVAIWQGRCVASDEMEKDDLTRAEADLFLPREEVPGGTALHTMIGNRLVRSAGIDESNGEGYYILQPRRPNETAEEIRAHFQKTFGITTLGVIITDSYSTPLRRGALGATVGFAGLDPIKDNRGEQDIFGREIQWSQSNMADALSAAAVCLMGEVDECTPCAVITDPPRSIFAGEYDPERQYGSFEVPIEEDIFAPFFTHVRWERGGGGFASET